MKTCPKKNPWIRRVPTDPRPPNDKRQIEVILRRYDPKPQPNTAWSCYWTWEECGVATIVAWRYKP